MITCTYRQCLPQSDTLFNGDLNICGLFVFLILSPHQKIKQTEPLFEQLLYASDKTRPLARQLILTVLISEPGMLRRILINAGKNKPLKKHPI
jgi:hypothetical protein